MHLKYHLCQLDTACTTLQFRRFFLVVDFLHIHCGTAIPSQEGRDHSIKGGQMHQKLTFCIADEGARTYW